jgi:hypothetical protein
MRKPQTDIPATPVIPVIERMFSRIDVLASREEAISLKEISEKTGYISEAGQCLVMQARIAGRKLIMVVLDSAGKLGRIADAERVRRWVEANRHMISPAAATPQPTLTAAHVAS